jgi:hypothetical protein
MNEEAPQLKKLCIRIKPKPSFRETYELWKYRVTNSVSGSGLTLNDIGQTQITEIDGSFPLHCS